LFFSYFQGIRGRHVKLGLMFHFLEACLRSLRYCFLAPAFLNICWLHWRLLCYIRYLGRGRLRFVLGLFLCNKTPEVRFQGFLVETGTLGYNACRRWRV
ncbi:hypothetical protein PY67_02600, partial [Lacticaseibacillus rhamnosus]